MTPKTVFFVAASAFVFTTGASAQSVTLGASSSNTLIQVASSAGSAQLSNGQGDIFVGRTNQDGQGPATISIRRGLVAFDVADNVPAGATITGVSLAIQDVKGMNGDQTLSLSRMLRSWGQGTSYFPGGIGTAATNNDATWYYTFYNASNPAASPAWTVPGGESGVDFSSTASAQSLDSAGGTSNRCLVEHGQPRDDNGRTSMARKPGRKLRLEHHGQRKRTAKRRSGWAAKQPPLMARRHPH